jgi:predicted esterase
MLQESAVRAVKHALQPRPDVVRVRAGYRFRDGMIHDEQVVVVAVQEKLPKKVLAERAIDPIPAVLFGKALDVRTATVGDYIVEVPDAMLALEELDAPYHWESEAMSALGQCTVLTGGLCLGEALSIEAMQVASGTSEVKFFLHGFRSSGADFSRWWASKDRGQPRVFLDGPETDPLTSFRRWFSFTGDPIRLRLRVVEAGIDAEAQIMGWLKSVGLDPLTPIALTGHSQGAMVVLDLLYRATLQVSEADCYAGFHPSAILGDKAWVGDSRRTTVRLFSSTRDTYVNVADVQATFDQMRTRPGTDLYHFVSSSLDHEFGSGWLDYSKFELREVSHG